MHILVVEDDKYFNKLICDTLTGAGHEIKTALDGTTALRMLDERGLDLVILDMLLPRIMGNQLCKEVRARFPSLPIVAISGVYKNSDQINEIKQQFGITAYLCKPFNLDEFLTVIAALAEAPPQQKPDSPTQTQEDSLTQSTPSRNEPQDDRAAIQTAVIPMTNTAKIPPNGDLKEHPIEQLIIRNYFSIETGILHIQNESYKRKIYFSNGFPVFATSTALSETLGAVLKKNRIITDAELNAASREMVERGVFLGEVLIEKGIMKSEDFYKLLREQIHTILINAFSWREGTFEFEPTKLLDETILKIEFNPMLLIYLGFAKFTPIEEVRRFFSDCSERYLARTARFDRLLPLLNLKGQAHDLLRAPGSEATVQSLLSAIPETQRDQLLRILHVLYRTEMIELNDEPSAEVPVVTASALPSNVDFGPIIQTEHESKINKMHSELSAHYVKIINQDYFQTLGVEKGAEADLNALNRAYKKRLQEFEADRFGPIVGEDKRMLNEILSKIENAYQTLRNKNLKTDYNAFTEKRSYDSAIEAKLYLDAQEYFHEASDALKIGQFENASSLYMSAFEKWPKAVEYQLYSIYADFLLALEKKQDKERAKTVFSNYLVLERTNAGLDVYFLLKGHMHLKLGNLEDAKTCYNHTVALNPHSDEGALALQTVGGIERKHSDVKGLFSLYRSVSRKLAGSFIVMLIGVSVIYHFGFFLESKNSAKPIDLGNAITTLPFTRATQTKSTIELSIQTSDWNRHSRDKLAQLMAEVREMLQKYSPTEILVYDEANQLLSMTVRNRTFFYSPKNATKGK